MHPHPLTMPSLAHSLVNPIPFKVFLARHKHNGSYHAVKMMSKAQILHQGQVSMTLFGD
jgi:hypothetical protein